MKSIQNQYRDLKEGRMSQANFMRNLRMTMPQYITNVTSFNDSVRILKNKGILNELGPAAQQMAGNPEEEAEYRASLIKQREPNIDDEEEVEYEEDEDEYDPEEIKADMQAEFDGEQERERLYDMDEDKDEDDDAEMDALIKKYSAEKQGEEDILSQWDPLEENIDNEEAQDMAMNATSFEDAVNRLWDAGVDINTAREIASQYHREDLDEATFKENKENKNFITVMVADKARKSFVRDLENNKIEYDFIKGFNTIKVENTPKVKMAIQLVKERFGQQSIKVQELAEAKKPNLHPNQIHPQELRMGIKVEMEHTDDPKKAEKIALDHLAENPFYYTALKLSGVESPSAPKIKQPKEAKAKKEAVEMVDKANQMKPVKGINKAKASANKAHKETNKAVSGISLMSLVAKSVRGVGKMDPTGEKSKKINVKEGQHAFVGTLKDNEESKLKSIIPDAEIKQEGNQTIVTSSKYNEKMIKHAVEQAKGNNKSQGMSSGEAVAKALTKEQLVSIIKKELSEMFDGRDNLTDTE